MRQTERKRKEKSALGRRQRIGDLYCKDISEWIYKVRRQNTEEESKGSNHESTKEEGGSCFRDEFLSLVFVFGLGSGALADG